ncbi:hypothetical protein M2G45_15580 [Vibrio vulnificus]|nr:hypothetical protein [Vibrio vulnificus]
MRSHYKRIGDYVTLVKLKNSDGAISSLKGININKHFMPSVANVNGTDLSTYRVVKKNQFAFNPMHVGRDEVLPISMLEDDEPIIVSPAYVVFEVKDEEKLLPAYLMMWCRRSEFDRNAWFMTDNSVRGGFSWTDFCDMELPVPSIEKQREIVREYNVVNDRIALNEQLTQKLEDTAQAIYKQWFVDFEFPISKEYAESIGKPELEGKPYKSSGGEMEYCEALGCETPITTQTIKLEKLASTNSENINLKKEKFTQLNYLDTGSITENHIEGFQTLVIGKDKIPSRAKRKVRHNSIVYSTVRPNLRHYGLIKHPPENLVVSTGFCVIHSKNNLVSNELLLLLLSSDRVIDEYQSKGEMSVSTYPSIKPEDILDTLIPLPNEYFETDLGLLNQNLAALFNHIDLISKEKLMLIELKTLIEKNIINRA